MLDVNTSLYPYPPQQLQERVKKKVLFGSIFLLTAVFFIQNIYNSVRIQLFSLSQAFPAKESMSTHLSQTEALSSYIFCLNSKECQLGFTSNVIRYIYRFTITTLRAVFQKYCFFQNEWNLFEHKLNLLKIIYKMLMLQTEVQEDFKTDVNKFLKIIHTVKTWTRFYCW